MPTIADDGHADCTEPSPDVVAMVLVLVLVLVPIRRWMKDR
jgi:hypothetical protein